MSGGYSLNMDADLLIKEVYLRRPLWDRTNKQHGNRVLVNRLWEEVAQVVGAPIDATKQKWQGLRATFRVELNKTPDGRAQDPTLHPDEYLTNWCFFKSLFFLRDNVSRRRKPTATVSAMPYDLVDDEETVDHYVNCGETETKRIVASVQPTFIEMEQPPQTTSTSTNFQASFDQNYDVTVKRAFEEEGECKKVETADDDHYFFKSLLPYFKTMSPERKLFLRLKIQELVWKEVDCPEG